MPTYKRMKFEQAIQLIEKLEQQHQLTEAEYLQLLQYRFGTLPEWDDNSEEEIKTKRHQLDEQLFVLARKHQQQVFGNRIYVRGLIEVTNYCKNNCYYCGIRRENHRVERYRLTKEEILECCKEGYQLGFRTFVLQGGEDGYYTDDRLCDVIRDLRSKYPDCAITLSFGEWEKESYQRFFDAGANRYLLRHETADEEHYRVLHPREQNLAKRKECLQNLKDIGFQVGAGFMVGSPGQTLAHLSKDLMYLQEFQPHMVGIGPFLSHGDTPFAKEPNGSLEQTVFLLAILRLMNPRILLPATTALATLSQSGRERGILAGANVIMPNLSPMAVRKKYLLYDNKACTGTEAAQGMEDLRRQMQAIGYEVVTDRGDYPKS